MTLEIGIVASAFLVIGLAAGFFMHRSNYCMAGAFRDLFLFRSVNVLGSLVLLVAVSGATFEILRMTGLLSAYPFPKYAPPSISNMIGGLFFGVGMVMAGGCVVGVLYKFGGGNLLAGVAIIGVVIGSGIYAEIHPFWISAKKTMSLPLDAVTLPQLIGSEPIWPILLTVLLCGLISWQCWLKSRSQIKSQAEGYVPLWVTTLVLTTLSGITVLISGGPMSIATSYAKAAAVIESLVIPGHVQETAFFVARKSSLILPFTGQVVSGGAGPQLDSFAIVQYPLILGILGGSMWSAKLLGEFRFYWKVPPRQFVMTLLGGIVMALGARMTPGCNLWHLLGGLPILALHSILFVVGMTLGAWLGSLILKKVLA